MAEHANMDMHPVMGQFVGNHRIYTRTVVVFLVGIHVNLPILEQNVELCEHGPVDTPYVTMLQYQNRSEGFLPKRQKRKRPFHSMLTLDVAYRNKMPHFKLSRQNSIHVTGCCDISMLQQILTFLVDTYENRGFQKHADAPRGFVMDIVMSNLSFEFVVPRAAATAAVGHAQKPIRYKTKTAPSRSRDSFFSGNELSSVAERINTESTPDCTWTALLKRGLNTLNVIVYRNEERCNILDGCVYAFYSEGVWTMLSREDLSDRFGIQLGYRSRTDSFRVFQTGSVVHVGRWPQHMYHLQQQLLVFVRDTFAARTAVAQNEQGEEGLVTIRQHAKESAQQ